MIAWSVGVLEDRVRWFLARPGAWRPKLGKVGSGFEPANAGGAEEDITVLVERSRQ